MACAIDTAAAISGLEDASIESAAARAFVRTVTAADDELATKSDLAVLKADLTIRTVGAQVATAMLLFAALRFLGT